MNSAWEGTSSLVQVDEEVSDHGLVVHSVTHVISSSIVIIISGHHRGMQVSFTQVPKLFIREAGVLSIKSCSEKTMPSASKADVDVSSQVVTSTMKKINTQCVHVSCRVVSYHIQTAKPAAKMKKPPSVNIVIP